MLIGVLYATVPAAEGGKIKKKGTKKKLMWIKNKGIKTRVFIHL